MDVPIMLYPIGLKRPLIFWSTITGGEITLQNASIDHLGAFTNVMTKASFLNKLENGDIRVQGRPEELSSLEIITLPYLVSPQIYRHKLVPLQIPGLSILTERV